MTLLLLAFFTNLWIWRVLIQNIFIGILLLIITILLAHRLFVFSLLTMVLICVWQIKTTQPVSLVAISNDDRRVIDMRLKAYPARFLRVGHWLEERKESLAFRRISQNLFENLDLNLYFFANHPRQRVGIKEFEKFPYVLLPVFLIGFFGLLSQKYLLFWLVSFFLPLLVLSFVGNQNSLGPFSLFPFFSIVIFRGLEKIKLNFWKVTIFLLVLIQIIAYEIY